MKDKHNDVDFEIKFYEGVVKTNPDFVDALSALGDLYTKKGLFEKGLEIDVRLSRLKPKDPMVLYNLACSYALLDHLNSSFNAIKKSIKCGYDDFDYLFKDKDLEKLRDLDIFKQYFAGVKKRRISKQKTSTNKNNI